MTEFEKKALDLLGSIDTSLKQIQVDVQDVGKIVRHLDQQRQNAEASDREMSGRTR